jgi:hypothetical protein
MRVDRVSGALGADVLVDRKLTEHLALAVDRSLLSITGNRIFVYLHLCGLWRD